MATWVLHAAGNGGDEETLTARLREVLADPSAGTTASQFSGLTHNGPVHSPGAAAAKKTGGRRHSEATGDDPSA